MKMGLLLFDRFVSGEWLDRLKHHGVFHEYKFHHFISPLSINLGNGAIGVIPEGHQRTVVFEQLSCLPEEILVIGINVIFLAYRLPLLGQIVGIVRIVGVWNGIIGPEFHSLFFTCFGEFLHYIPFESGIHNVIVGLFGIPETESVMMLAGQYDVFHPSRLGRTYPLVGVELHGVKVFVR